MPLPFGSSCKALVFFVLAYDDALQAWLTQTHPRPKSRQLQLVSWLSSVSGSVCVAFLGSGGRLEERFAGSGPPVQLEATGPEGVALVPDALPGPEGDTSPASIQAPQAPVTRVRHEFPATWIYTEATAGYLMKKIYNPCFVLFRDI